MEELSDEAIMMKVKEGNLADLAMLFERYHVKLYNFFLRLTFDKIVSQDLTQNLFYRILKYRHTYKEKESGFKSWIYRMARNVHSDHYRLEKRNNEYFKRVEPGHENMQEYDDTFKEDDFKKLERALQQLDPDHREIIVMSRFEGLKYDEISKIRNMSVPAIKVQVHRTMKELRKIYFGQ